MRSYHLVGQALDFVPIQSNGTEDWNGYNKEPWASAIRYAKQIGFEWGGDWKGFVDSPHLQYNYKGYGTDTFGKGAQNVVAPPTSNDSVGIAYINGSNVNLRKGWYWIWRYSSIRERRVLQSIWAIKWLVKSRWRSVDFNDPSYIRYTGGNVPTPSQSSNEGIGVVTIIADVLRVRTGPGTNYGIVKNVYQGEKYQSFGYKDGWYNVGGNQWVSGEYVTFVK